MSDVSNVEIKTITPGIIMSRPEHSVAQSKQLAGITTLLNDDLLRSGARDQLITSGRFDAAISRQLGADKGKRSLQPQEAARLLKELGLEGHTDTEAHIVYEWLTARGAVLKIKDNDESAQKIESGHWASLIAELALTYGFTREKIQDILGKCDEQLTQGIK